MNKLTLFFSKIYSLFFCFKYFPFKEAIRIPVLLHYSVKIGAMHKGAFKFSFPVKSPSFIFGFEATEGRSRYHSYLSIHPDGNIICDGLLTMARGGSIIVKDGIIHFGEKVVVNGDCFFNCDGSSITIGDDILCGWGVNMNTYDGHAMLEHGIRKEKRAPIKIGNHVWIGANSTISKGVEIPNHCIVSQNSLVVKKHTSDNTLIGGMPAKDIKNNIDWEII